MSATGTRIDLDWGYIEYSKNEVSIISTVEDPPGLRLGAMHGGSMAKISINHVRPDGVQDEIGILQGKIDERFRGPEDGGTGTGFALVGEWRFDVRRPPRDGDPSDDKQMEPGLQILYDKVVVHKPLMFADGGSVGGGGNGGGGGAPSILSSPNGRVQLAAQSDDNLVLYIGGVAVKAVHGLPPEKLW